MIQKKDDLVGKVLISYDQAQGRFKFDVEVEVGGCWIVCKIKCGQRSMEACCLGSSSGKDMKWDDTSHPGFSSGFQKLAPHGTLLSKYAHKELSGHSLFHHDSTMTGEPVYVMEAAHIKATQPGASYADHRTKSAQGIQNNERNRDRFTEGVVTVFGHAVALLFLIGNST